MLTKLSIKQKLILIMSIPLIVVILLAGKLTYDSYSYNSSLIKLEKVVILSTKIGSLLHETQKERGMTAGYLGSKGKKFADKLPNQRENADQRINELKDFLTSFDFKAYGSNFEDNLNSALNNISKFSDIRARVTSQNIKTGEAIAFYTQTNTLLLNLIGAITQLSNSSEVSQDIISYMNFLLSKERAGIERAVGANTFARDNFGPGMKAKFYTLIAAQNSYMDSFLKVADLSAQNFYKQNLQGSAIDEVEKMRKVALYSGKDSNFGIDASYWFAEITKKINALKKVEDHLAKKLTNTIIAEEGIAKENMIIFGILSFIGIATTLILARTIAFTILLDVDSVKKGLTEFFAFINFEKDDIHLEVVESQDELGMMSKLINENINKTKANIQADRDLIANTIDVANKINKGYLNTRIESNSNNPSLQELKNIINEMLHTLNMNIENIMNVLNSYSKLDFRPQISSNDLEGIIKELEEDVNILGKVITETLVENKKSGLILSQNANTLSHNMDKISAAANDQAARLEETAASLEEITSNITNNTETTSQMAKFGHDVKMSVQKGQELANNTTSAMEEINEQTSAITEAITVIDQIAFQTNILSLNAAVEAATAGEAGKGFAVVAQEVRNLAARSAEAAKEIKDIVESAQAKTAEGKKAATEMIEGYEELNININQTLELIDNVTVASKEQSTGIVQINDAVNNLDKITQQNAQSASEADAIANRTLEISNMIIEHADAKEFDGKNNIEIRENTTNLSFNGVERRQPETKIKQLRKKQNFQEVESNDSWESF